MTRWRWLVAGVLAAAILALATVWALTPRSLTKQDVDQLRTGMSQEEVERVLGRPPDQVVSDDGNRQLALWRSSRFLVFLLFVDGQLQSVLTNGDGSPVSFLKDLADWLGL